MSYTTVTGSSAKVRAMAEGALCVALSVVFSYLKLFAMPQGGSITVEMAPLIYFACRRGVLWGLSAGAMSGFLQMIFGGYIMHPIQAALDYPIASAAVGLAGLFASRPLIGAITGGLARLVCHVISGAVFFASYAPEGQNPWVYSIVYNATPMIPNIIICAAFVIMLMRVLNKKRR